MRQAPWKLPGAAEASEAQRLPSRGTLREASASRESRTGVGLGRVWRRAGDRSGVKL